MTSENADTYLGADTLQLVKLTDTLKQVQKLCLNTSNDLKQYHEKVFSEEFLQHEGRTVTNQTVDQLAEMFVQLAGKSAQLRIEYAIMAANANERLETIEKLVSKIMETSEKTIYAVILPEDHLRRMETLSMQVEELLQQKQIAVEALLEARQTLLEDGDSGESSPPRGSSGGAEKGKLLFPSRARNACVLFPSPSS